MSHPQLLGNTNNFENFEIFVKNVFYFLICSSRDSIRLHTCGDGPNSNAGPLVKNELLKAAELNKAACVHRDLQIYPSTVIATRWVWNESTIGGSHS